ncbi:cytochrome d ubiquinol oxidase subunit II [Elusimicrobiota bacterium]
MPDLNITWFLLIGVLFTVYAILDGFDLGVGILHMFSKTDDEKRLAMSSIGPVWDGNEVWLLTGVGALFAAFPRAYATIFSGFYIIIMFLLFSLILRAVSLEFRSKLPMLWWRSNWDTSFHISSLMTSLLLGVALGNIIRGIPLNIEGEFVGTLVTLLTPYSLLIGATTAALFSMHGAIYLLMKTEGDFQAKIRRWAMNAFALFTACFVIAVAATLFGIPKMFEVFRSKPVLLAIPVINLVLVANIIREIRAGRDLRAFLSSSAMICCLMGLVGLGIYPNFVISVPDPEFNLTIYNASSSQMTLGIMLKIALIGLPLVLLYTAYVYRVFRGKVKLDSSSY